jgi:CRP-like cAMP-binding protein
MEALLTYISSLSPLEQECLDRIASLFSPFQLKKGENFIKSGQVAKRLGFLQSGIVRAFYRADNGEEYNKHFFTAPAFIGGFASLISGKPNYIIQQAMVDCDVLVADYQKFTALYDVFPSLERAARRLGEMLYIDKEKREVEIVLLDAEARYIKFQQEYKALEQQIPQYHIASFLGITPTQLSRIRRKLASQ